MKCKLCPRGSKDLKTLYGHLRNIHDGMTIHEYYERFPEELEKQRNKPKKKSGRKPVKKGKVSCKLCGRWFFAITNTHLKKEHGITSEEYKAQFENAKTVSNTTLNLRARDSISKKE